MMDYIRLNLGITKTYLIKCEGGYLLVDTGYPKDYGKFVKKLNQKRVKIEEIKYLLLTHYHDDHSGFACKMKAEQGIPLILQKKSVPLLAKGNSGDEVGGTYVTRRLRALFRIFELFHREFTFSPVISDQNDIIVDGDDEKVLRSIGVDGKILYTPGHTEDSMTVLLDNGKAFVGDAVMNFLKFTGTGYRPIYYTDEEKMYESVARIVRSGAKTIIPAHGNPFSVGKLMKLLQSS